MKKTFLIALAFSFAALGQQAEKPVTTKTTVSAPEAKIPDEKAAAYWRVWAMYQNFSLQWEHSLTAEQKAIQAQMTDAGRKVQGAISEVDAWCAAQGSAKMDMAALQKDGALKCMPPAPSEKKSESKE